VSLCAQDTTAKLDYPSLATNGLLLALRLCSSGAWHQGEIKQSTSNGSLRSFRYAPGNVFNATQTVNELQNGFRFRFEDSLQDQLPVRIPNRRGDRCLMHIQPNILGVIHEGATCCWITQANEFEIEIRILIGNLPVLAHRPQTISELNLIFTRNSKCASMKLSEWVMDSTLPSLFLLLMLLEMWRTR
jgi:hypothetical protein